MKLEFSIEGERQLSRRLRGISTQVKNWKSEMGQVGKYLIKTFSGPVFDTKGREIGEAWPPRKKNYPWPILQKTGKMRKSFDNIARSTSVEIYNKTSYFRYHQSNKPRKKLPRRPMMKIDQERRTGIVKIFHKRLVNDIIKKRY